jgi:3-dehydroquinate synthase
MKIVLTGFMGTGKTSVGKELSGQLNYTFIDTDVLIEQKEGMPISLIFKNKGENYFRELEQATVAEVSELDNVVIATGGGVIKNKKNVIYLGKGGVLVWLKADPEIILKRVMLEGGKRPLLDVEEPLHEINKLLEERVELYRQADTSIDTTYITPGETAHEIIDKLGLESERVRVDLGARSYEIIIGSRLMQKLGLRIREFRPSKVAIISNKKVFPIYRDSILKSLREYNYDPEILLMPDGEEYKDLLWTYHFHGELLKARFDRSSLLIALGGGVIGDITGFVASTYMRGIRFIQVPTTLLSQVDSSVGGKTGVNHPLGKNMIGTFYQPSLVFIDIDTLKTLPTNEFLSGMAEVIKYGIIADREFFDYLTTNKDDILSFGDSIIHVIKRSCEIKADVVSKDEQESGLRAILNFGHTIGHAIETVTAYKKFLHGEAIAIGMCAAAELALKSGIFSSDDTSLIREIIESYNLPSFIPGDVNTEEILHTMELDKKVTAGKMKFVLPEAIGKVRIKDNVDRQLIRDVIGSCQI